MNKEREKQILERLLKHKKVSVLELSRELFVSQPSIRRDLKELENKHLIKRVHGGAVIEETVLSQNRIPFLLREMEESTRKIIIAKKAAELVKDNDTVFLDSSTSAYNLVEFLAQKKNITVITNGVKILDKLAKYSINTISTGGHLTHSCLSLVGEEAYKTIESINADIAFFSCRGVSEDGYLTDIAPEENYIRIRMIKNAKTSYLLCTKEKFGKKFYHNLCHKNDITGIIDDME